MTKDATRKPSVRYIRGDKFTMLVARVAANMQRSIQHGLVSAGVSCMCGKPPFNDFDDPCPVCELALSIKYLDSTAALLATHYEHELPAALKELYGEKAPEPIVKALRADNDNELYEECDE